MITLLAAPNLLEPLNGPILLPICKVVISHDRMATSCFVANGASVFRKTMQ